MSESASFEQLPSTPTSPCGPAMFASGKYSSLSLLAYPWPRSSLGSPARHLRDSSSFTALQPSTSVYLSHCFCSACFELPTMPGHHSCGQFPHWQVTTLYSKAVIDVELCCHQPLNDFTVEASPSNVSPSNITTE